MSARIHAQTSILRLIRPTQLRALHSSRPVFDLPEDLPPAPRSAEALGFTPQIGRQRDLPEDLQIPIPISTSGQSDLLGRSSSNDKPPRRNTGRNDNDNRRSGSRSVTVRPPRLSVNTESTENFFGEASVAEAPSTGSRSRRALKDVSMDVVGTSVPPDVARRQRRNDSSKGKKQGQGERRSKDKGVNASPRDKRVMMPRRQLTLETLDHSSEGLFGKRSLVAGTGSKSIVLHTLSHARKLAPNRQSNSHSALPNTALPVLSPASTKSVDQAVQIASWSAALNASIGPRAKSRLSEAVSAQLSR